MSLNKDESLKQAGDILIAAFPDMFGSITFNLQGKRKTIHSNVVSKLAVESSGGHIAIDIKESKKL